MEPNDVIERYDEVKEQVDQMDEEEISNLAGRVVAVASAIEDPSDSVVRNVVEFFEQERISPEARILGIRTLGDKNMTGKIISETLARLLAVDIEVVPPSFWEQDDEDNGLIMEIDVCKDINRLEQKYINRSDLSNRVRRAAAMKAYQLAELTEDMIRFALLKEKYSD